MQSRFSLGRLGGDLSEYVDGAILYMYLEDFVTYDRCELYPGPYMNMVMGPNGSGKSSIVAAMALGLGWHPSVLGRSKDPAEYVKYGRGTAIIEIVIKCTVDLEALELPSVEAGLEDVLILQRHLHRAKMSHRHTSEWFINGRTVSAKSVASLMNRLNVQIDNLCQFLPQDKVGDFARLTPSELLIETQKAAAEPATLERHLALIGLRAKEKELMSQNEETGRRLDSLEKQNKSVESIIESIRQRESHLRTIQLAESKRPWLLYNSARETYMQTKARRDEARGDLEQAECSANPIRERLRQAQEALAKAGRKKTAKTSKAEQLFCRLTELTQKELPNLGVEIDKCRTEIQKGREQKTRRQTAITEIQRTIRLLEDELRSTPEPQPDEEDFRKELSQVSQALAEVEMELAETEEQINRIRREGERLIKEIDACNADLRQLDDVRWQRLETVRRINEDTYKAYLWIEKHRNLFKEPVYGPLCLEVNVKEPKFARQAETVIPKNILLNYVVTNDEDYEVFMGRMCEGEGIKANLTIISDADIAGARTALDRGALRKLGFIGTVLDVLDGPAPVLAALVDSAKVHLIPIAKGTVDDKAIESSFREIQKYVTSEGCFEIKTSAYSDEVINRFTQMKNSIFFSQSNSDGRKSQLLARIGERRKELSINEGRMRRLITEQDSCRGRQGELNHQRGEINERRLTALGELSAWRRKKSSIEIKRGNLQKLQGEEERDEEGQQEERLKRELRDRFGQHRDKTQMACFLWEEYLQLVLGMGVEHLAIVRYEGMVARLQDELRSSETQYDNLRNALASLEAELIETKTRAKELLDQASRQELDDATKEAFADLPETLEELDKLLMMERTRLNASGSESSLTRASLEDYESRKEQIVSLRETLERKRGEILALREESDRISGEWLPLVREMTLRISARFEHFFAQMRCAGQIRLGERGSDWQEYSLEILVKFREEEALHVLTAQRQSGGEKSVSTILFLLSLQELAKSPFRVVDEINQGMDANNERRVHSLIVDTATKAATSQ